jgi:hypothetical protein
MEYRYCLKENAVPVCYENYYIFGWQGTSFTAIFVFIIYAIFIWQIMYQDPESYKREDLEAATNDQKTFDKILTNPYSWIALIFLIIWVEYIIIMGFIQLIIEPFFNGIANFSLYTFYWVFFGSIYAGLCSTAIFFSLRRFLYLKSE